MNNNEFTIITFYQFKKISNPEKIKKILKDFCFFHKIRGTILLAKEGINGTISGLINPIKAFEEKIINLGFTNMESKRSFYKYMPFNRLKIKIKNEIVTFDGNYYNVEKNKAKYVNSKDWNTLIQNKNTIIIDVRNDFEHKIGTFKKALNPQTRSFSNFKKYIDIFLNRSKEKNIALFCTGGIRCEKASSYMLNKGFKNLYQLKGGILKYLEDTPKQKSLWKGECFVFDNRVSVKNELSKGSYSICRACRYPINFKDKKSTKYEKGVSCPRCCDKLTKDKKSRLKERNKQIKLSKKKGIYNPYLKMTTLDF